MTDTAVAPVEDRDHKRSAALMRAINLDKVPAEQRELALAIAKRYELDLLLKHLVLVDGRPYITRDGLLHVAHRSGQLDGIEVTDPELIDKFWHAKCSVYRKDMSRPFTYGGRYPAQGGNQRYAPEMAVKVAEVMSLRRAFDVSAPVIEERWDIDTQTEVAPAPPISEVIAAKRAALTPPDESEAGVTESSPTVAGAPEATSSASSANRGKPTPAPDAGALPPVSAAADDSPPESSAPLKRCEAFSPEQGACVRPPGHQGHHANKDRESWA